jgi:membrane glycosyltransferase
MLFHLKLQRNISLFAAPAGTTPTGLQKMGTLTRRRLTLMALVVLSVAALGSVWAYLLIDPAALARNSASETETAMWFSPLDIGLLVAFIISAPWMVLGFWNAVIGFWLLHGVRDWRSRVAPFLSDGDSEAPINLRTAIIITLRNEDPARAFAKLEAVRRSVEATGHGSCFDYFVLSDTSDADIAALEEAIFARWRTVFDDETRATYRRRQANIGFKAGNVGDFVTRFGGSYDLMLPLDADSLMSGSAILRLVRIMQAHPQIGILQSLVVGTPATSAFARIFQFGMRHGMRSYTMGSAWWQGDCGPFWGHNALVRIAPFAMHCTLPVLPGSPPLGGHVLSHDQIEAVLMRRGGFEVRVVPVEDQSWEDNPPTLLDFTKRDLRWCQGNMQYWRLLGLAGLHLTSRFQVFAAIMMYVSAPAWIMLMILSVLKASTGEMSNFDVTIGFSLFAAVLTMSLMPKIAGLADVVLTKGGVRSYGGPARFAAGAVTEILFMMMLAPVIAFRVTTFMIGLVFGRSVLWSGQARDAYQLTWTTALRGLWPQTLFGLALFGLFLLHAPSVMPWASPLLLGLIFCIPLAVLSSSPAIGNRLAQWGLCAVPEEATMPIELANAAIREFQHPAAGSDPVMPRVSVG